MLSDAAIGCELIFVDDGSKDATWEKITALSASGGIRGLHFSRNFGKEAAILAGLAAAKGDCCVVIDGDLQHPPEKIVEMYRLWEQGYEIVEGQKATRGAESHAHGLAARAFYSLISRATGIDMANASDFKLLDRKAVNVLINMRERNAFFRALSSWIGFKTVSIPFDVQKRAGGRSKWSTPALAKYAVDNIASFSAAPMQLVTVLGGIMLARLARARHDRARAEVLRARARRLHHRGPHPAFFQQHHHDKSRHHRLLHFQNLRGSEGKTPVYHHRYLRRRRKINNAPRRKTCPAGSVCPI